MKKIITSFILFTLIFCTFSLVKAEEERKPDLKILDIYFYPNNPVVNELFNGEIRVKITNQGNSAIQAMEGECPYVNSLKYISDGTVLDWLNTDHRIGESIICGKTISGDMEIVYGLKDFKFSSSQLTLTSNIDSSNKIDELDEENNTYSEVITIENIKQPDIVGDYVSVREGGNENKTLSRIPEVGEKFYLWPVYKNIGDIKTDNTDFNIDVYVDGIFSKKLKASNIDIMANLGDGMYIDDKIELALEEGLHEIKFVLDSDNNIQESDEENNVLIWNVTISNDNENEDNLLKPDLVVRGVHLPSAEDKRFTVEVRNQGDIATSFSDGIKISASVKNSDNSLVALKSSYNYIDNLEPDKFGSATFYITGGLSEEVELKIWVDNAENGDGGFIDESNENNNIFTKAIIIRDDNTNTNNDTDNNTDTDENTNTNTNADVNNLVLKLQRQISALEKQVIILEKKLTNLDQKFANKYSGTMFLDVENHGRLWYVDPVSKNRFYFENGVSALSIGSKLATGITYEDIQKIPVGVANKLYNLKDSDGDGLPDKLESALGSDPNKSDTDGDGFNDKEELENNYNPANNEKYSFDQSLIKRLEGKMMLQVSGPNSHGEIWYIKDGQRWYGGTEDSMYEIMKARSLGATSENIRKIEVGGVSGTE